MKNINQILSLTCRQVFLEASYTIGALTDYSNLYDDGNDGDDDDGIIFGAGKLCFVQGVCFQWWDFVCVS